MTNSVMSNSLLWRQTAQGVEWGLAMRDYPTGASSM